MTTSTTDRLPDWERYLEQFHAEHPGITEDLLTKARYGENTAYAWLAEAVPARSTVLDLACGSGPLLGLLPDPAVHLGADLSAPELRLARGRGLPVACAEASRLPLPDSSVDVVVVSMALMLVPLDATLSEVRRVLVPGGLLVATVPASGPLGVRDRLRWGRLLFALRQRSFSYPSVVTAELLKHHGLHVMSEDRRSFSFSLGDAADADLLLESLYLPGVTGDRCAAGRSVVRRWVGSDVPIPLRRVVARRRD